MDNDRLIRMEEVKKHNDLNSVWMVIHDLVYDVTPFLDEHPGGAQSLIDQAGRESTEEFEDIGHSDDAREEMKKYKVGQLHPDDKNRKDPKCSTNMLKMALAGLGVLLVVGFVVKRYVLT